MSKKRIIVLSIVLFFSALSSIAQVNLQTGSATFSLPMFNWQDDKSRLNSIVALSYNSGNGLKVNEVASNVGQGWNLVAGGVISRMQVGEPDDQAAFNGSGDQSEHDITKYPAGILYATVPAYNGCPNALAKYPLYKKKNQIYKPHNVIAEDKEFDYFSFQFNGKAGMFVLDPTNMGVAQSLGDTKMKITFLTADMTGNQIRTRITSFSIQDVDGLIYKFSTLGLTKVLQANYCDKTLYQLRTQPKFKSDHVYHMAGFDNGAYTNPWVVGSWYLDEIKDPLTQRKITFTYTPVPRNVNNVAGTDIAYNSIKDYTILTHKTSISKTPEIISIAYPDSHLVSFNYDANSRTDLNGEMALSSVDITYQGRFLSKYQLTTSYFIRNRYGSPKTTFQNKCARLCLRSVQKTGVDLLESTPPYIFDYYLGSDSPDDFVPPPFFYAKDIWGFYNGDNSKGFYSEVLPLNSDISELKNHWLKGLAFLNSNVSGVVLNPKTGYAKNGLLKQIIYPTGGTLTYQYAQNTGIITGQSQELAVGGVHVSQTSSTDGGNSNGCGSPITTSYNYVMNGAGSASSLWGLEMPVNFRWSASHYDPVDQRRHWTPSCLLTCCYYTNPYPGILAQQQAVGITTMQNIMNILSPVLSILSLVGTIQDIATLIGTSAPGFGTIVAVVLDVIGAIVELFTSCSDQSQNPSTTIYFNMDLNAISPLPSQFKRVEVVENPGTIGKTVQEFTSKDDYPIWFNSNPGFSAKQRYAPWAYGLPKRTSIYDATGNLIKQTENKYDTNYARNLIEYCCAGIECELPCNPSGLYTSMVSCKCDVIQNYSQKSSDWTNPSIYNATYITSPTNSDITVNFYGMYTGRINLDTTYERVYKVGDASKYVETYTRYHYNSTYGYGDYSNFEVNEIETKQSNGDKILKDIKYPGSYSGGALTTLAQNNIIAIPVETVNSVIKSGTGNSLYLNEQVTEFTQLANGDIKPSRILEQRFNQPAVSATLYLGPGSNVSNYKVPQVFSYGVSGNLIGLKDEGNRSVTNIYDYLEKYIGATVINADSVIDLPAYSSFESTGFGGWVLTGGSAAYNTSTSITGTRSFNLASLTLTRTINTAKPYILSFWANNSNVIVSSGSTLIKSAPMINGLTYYEYNIAQSTSSVSVSGNASIDELRIYPAAARMRSITYDPLIGKTSECDENNRITYYEYDNLGRLRFIKDESKNIVKMYEYNNVSGTKQNGCPGTYYNHFISEVFTRSNCSAGYAGADTTFTVAANTYSSTISQADADAKAETYILTNGQNFANTNGICKLLYYNTLLSQVFTTQCEQQEGYTGGNVTYTVPAQRYSSTISQADADEQATDEMEANGQEYANSHGTCTVDTNPHWVWQNGGQTNCQMVSGQNHQFLLMTDLNPNSPTYNQTQWKDAGPQAACPTTYCNAQLSMNFPRTNCAPGLTGTMVFVTVPANTYCSSVSQAYVDSQAFDYVMNYANQNGLCGYLNVAKSASAVKSNCTFNSSFAISVTGNSVTYTIPAGTYFSTISQADADAQAQTAANNGAQAHANAVNACTWYNTAVTSYKQKNDCTPPGTGTYASLTVPSGTYSSTVSDYDAYIQAYNYAWANITQAYANQYGSCNYSCSFSAAPGFTLPYSFISGNGITVGFIITLYSTNGTANWYNNNQVATINGSWACLPTVTRVFNMSEGGRTWEVTITPAGAFSIRLLSGTPPTGTTTIGFSNGSFYN